MPFLPLILGLAPTVASWIMGDKTGSAISKVTEIARDIIGSDNANDIEKAVANDPEIALRFKMAILQAEADARAHQAEMGRQEMEQMKASLADVQSARSTQVELAKAGSSIAWGAPAVSVMSLGLAGAVAYLVLFPDVNQAKWTETVVTMLVGAAINWVGMVQSYWLGSSSGSAAKDVTLRQALTPKG